jgi:serine/threonine-protein kinase
VAPVRAGETVADKYVVEHILGVGGMGVVVAARDKLLERKVAIKFLLPRLASSDTAVQRFVREARAAIRITSEHVVKLIEIDKLTNGTPFLVMEFLEGKDLRALMSELGTLPVTRAVDYVLQALQAIAEGHIKNIIHRDIKPGNLFLTTRADGTPLIKVLDFGIAKTLVPEGSESFALTGSDDIRLGSPAYMPPEQLRSPKDVDVRADIWALGATLYELLCGNTPFRGSTYAELISQVLSAPPEPLTAQLPDLVVPEELQAVIAKCLQKDRNQRYPNTMELAVALAPFGSNDARISLTRISGMWTHVAPRGARISDAPDGANLGTATTESLRPSSSSAKPSSKRGVSILLAAVLSAALVVLAVSWRSKSAEPPVSSQATTANHEQAVTPPSLKLVPQVPSAQPSSTALAVTPIPSAALSLPSALATNASAAARAPKPLASVAINKPPPTAPSASVSNAAPLASTTLKPEPETGESPDIEKLIEQRR